MTPGKVRPSESQAFHCPRSAQCSHNRSFNRRKRVRRAITIRRPRSPRRAISEPHCRAWQRRRPMHSSTAARNSRRPTTPRAGSDRSSTKSRARLAIPILQQGGGSAILETRFGHAMNGWFDPMTNRGGSLLQDKAIDPRALETLPPQANVVAKRKTTPLFGGGLIEAIPDTAILANASRAKPDGVQGRTAVVQDVAWGQSRIGRFGWKAQQAMLLAFAADAYLNEMGITNRLFLTENAPNGNPALLARYDQVADPEDSVDPLTGRSDMTLSPTSCGCWRRRLSCGRAAHRQRVQMSSARSVASIVTCRR